MITMLITVTKVACQVSLNRRFGLKTAEIDCKFFFGAGTNILCIYAVLSTQRPQSERGPCRVPVTAAILTDILRIELEPVEQNAGDFIA